MARAVFTPMHRLKICIRDDGGAFPVADEVFRTGDFVYQRAIELARRFA